MPNKSTNHKGDILNGHSHLFQPLLHTKHRPPLWLWIVALIIALAFGIGLGLGIGYGFGHFGSTDTNTAVNNASMQWTVVQTFSGTSGKNTGTFYVSNPWRMRWTCQPPAPSDNPNSYHIAISVYNADGTLVDSNAVSTDCSAGNYTGDSAEHKGGGMYLKITANGPYTITIQDLE